MFETHGSVWASGFRTEGQIVIFQACYVCSTSITANTLDINYASVRWKIFWASICTLFKYKHALTHALHTLISHTVHIPFLLLSCKSIEGIRKKKIFLACIKKRLQGNIWSSQTAPCLANIQRILLPQKCEYVMYSQVTKQIQQGIHKAAERQWDAGSHHMQAKYIIHLWYLQGYEKGGSYQVLSPRSTQRTMKPQ